MEMSVRLKIYIQDLSDLPGDKVLKTIRAFRRGEIGDGKWAPTVGEIRKVIYEEMGREMDALAAERRREKADAERLALREKACLRDDERARQRAAEYAAAIIAELKAAGEPKVEAGRLPTENEAKAWVARFEAGEKVVSPVSNFSDKLVAQILGELPIGQGKLGARPVFLEKPEAAE